MSSRRTTAGTIPATLRAAALLRLGLGGYALLTYLPHVTERAFLWGDHGVVPRDRMLDIIRSDHARSLYELANTSATFELLFWAGVTAAILYTAGVATRISGIANYVMMFSLAAVNVHVPDGGFNVYLLVAFYALFAETGAYFAPGAERRRRRFADGGRFRPYLNALHDYALLACCLQIAIVYLFSCAFKIEGHKWQDGTALYYILRSNEFNVSPIDAIVFHNPYVVTIGTYATLLFQLAFPWLVWNRKYKYVMLAGAIGLHLSIAICMGLVRFSYIMIVAEIAFYSDAELLAGAAALSRTLETLRPARWMAPGRVSTPLESAP
jgi:hypothetical protein